MNRAELIEYIKQGSRRLEEVQSAIERQKQRIEAAQNGVAVIERVSVLERLQSERIAYEIEFERLQRLMEADGEATAGTT